LKITFVKYFLILNTKWRVQSFNWQRREEKRREIWEEEKKKKGKEEDQVKMMSGKYTSIDAQQVQGSVPVSFLYPNLLFRC